MDLELTPSPNISRYHQPDRSVISSNPPTKLSLSRGVGGCEESESEGEEFLSAVAADPKKKRESRCTLELRTPGPEQECSTDVRAFQLPEHLCHKCSRTR
ncbi:hypothetical protein EYF80_014557 [Liparis tanakae]|uniref:Uncharacterized protein n=1 Tax=Liparis tanakae TaxID=230148 RepID=A0A4Z2IB10_9TELE|nr:hypothetical protein EYF80_014557 [Liparis tanakae]